MRFAQQEMGIRRRKKPAHVLCTGKYCETELVIKLPFYLAALPVLLAARAPAPDVLFLRRHLGRPLVLRQGVTVSRSERAVSRVDAKTVSLFDVLLVVVLRHSKLLSKELEREDTTAYAFVNKCIVTQQIYVSFIYYPLLSPTFIT